VYLALCALGLLPAFLNMAPALQATGLGLWFPGAGFIAVGGWALLLLPLTLVLFGLALFAWFGSGMVIAPPIVWLGAAALAGAMAGPQTAPYAALLVPGLVAGFSGWAAYRAGAKRQTNVKVREARRAALPGAVTAAFAAAADRPDAAARELSAEELAAARYLLDRALQPVDRFDGFDIVDQFQTSALRYQINHIGFGLAELQTHYAPNFQGYLGEAQRRLIQKYLHPKVWTYWFYETAWGHLNLTNFDPAAKDNIMLTGWLGLHVGMYSLASGDHRYAEPGSLTFRLNDRTAWPHDLHSLARSVKSNFDVAPFCLYPCEPNWVYPICNHYGLSSLVVNDRLFGTNNVEQIRDRWLRNLDVEFTDESGSLVGLRSSLTGLRFPFPGGELGFAMFMNTIAPDRAWRMWAVARSELLPAVLDDGEGPMLAISGPSFDFGNYRQSLGVAAAAILPTALEFGDEEIAMACRRRIDLEAGRRDDGGVLRYERMSNLMNISAARGHFHRRDDFRAAVAEGPTADLTGPCLAEARYPEVLVARAYSSGEDLDLVLYNGGAPGPQPLGLARLKPGRDYVSNTGLAFTADAEGKAKLDVPLSGRTALRITPKP
jgi:Linalool dehydratase/isomerase